MKHDNELVLTLYRGDSIPSDDIEAQAGVRVLLKHGFSLRARAFCGRPHLDRLVEQVLAHIVHRPGSPQEDLASDSPFISFSRNLQSAFSFMGGTRQQELAECQWLHEATHFLWRLRLAASDLLPMPAEFPQYAGWCWFKYRPNFEHVREHLVHWVRKEYESEAKTGDHYGLAQAIVEFVAAAHTEATGREHSAIIIDACTFIEYHCRGRQLYEQALDAATGDQEWLLYPYDRGEDGFATGEFVVNTHLSPVALYRLKGNSG